MIETEPLFWISAILMAVFTKIVLFVWVSGERRRQMNQAIDRHQASERHRREVELGERWLAAEKRRRKEFIELHRTVAAISTPSPEQWTALDAYDLFAPQHIAKLKEAAARIDAAGPEHWADVRRSLSGPFTLEKHQ